MAVSIGVSASTSGRFSQTDISDAVQNVCTTTEHWDSYAEQYGDGVFLDETSTTSVVVHVEDALKEQDAHNRLFVPTRVHDCVS